MSFIIESSQGKFDLSRLKKGLLVYAKHRSWKRGRGGFLTAVSEQELIVQYYPGMAGITNHFYLPIEEVTAGEWEIRWSEDLTVVESYGGEAVGN